VGLGGQEAGVQVRGGLGAGRRPAEMGAVRAFPLPEKQVVRVAPDDLAML
jgi:hypothetical protein